MSQQHSIPTFIMSKVFKQTVHHSFKNNFPCRAHFTRNWKAKLPIIVKYRSPILVCSYPVSLQSLNLFTIYTAHHGAPESFHERLEKLNRSECQFLDKTQSGASAAHLEADTVWRSRQVGWIWSTARRMVSRRRWSTPIIGLMRWFAEMIAKSSFVFVRLVLERGCFTFIQRMMGKQSVNP